MQREEMEKSHPTPHIIDASKAIEQYRSELLENVLPFWLEKSQDHQFGGY